MRDILNSKLPRRPDPAAAEGDTSLGESERGLGVRLGGGGGGFQLCRQTRTRFSAWQGERSPASHAMVRRFSRLADEDRGRFSVADMVWAKSSLVYGQRVAKRSRNVEGTQSPFRQLSPPGFLALTLRRKDGKREDKIGTESQVPNTKKPQALVV